MRAQGCFTAMNDATSPVRRAIVRFGANYTADDRRCLVDAVRPPIRELATIIVFPGGGVGARAPGADNLHDGPVVGGVLTDRSFQIEAAARPVDAPRQRRVGWNFKREHGLGEQQRKQLVRRRFRIVRNRLGVIDETAIGPFPGKNG